MVRVLIQDSINSEIEFPAGAAHDSAAVVSADIHIQAREKVTRLRTLSSACAGGE
jgi:hypothetical protein